MQTKLTLRMEKELIESAKEYALIQGKSVSKMVADYFALMGKNHDDKNEDIAPVTRSLKGTLKNIRLDETDYKKYLEKKYL